ncbi:MAG: S1 family peptidase [Pseudobdellovibrionaceae bacterium]
MNQASANQSFLFIRNPIIIVGMVCSLMTACAPQQKSSSGLNLAGKGSSSQIVNGVEIKSIDPLAKSTVALADLQGNQLSQFCSGTLIAKNVVVTAGHCAEYLLEVQEGYVLFGLTEKDSISIRIANAVIHEGYNNNSNFIYKGEKIGKNWNDLALIQMESDAPEGFVPAEILPDDALLVDLDVVTLAGYGLTSGGSLGKGAGILRKTDVLVEQTRFSDQEFVTDEVGTGSCNGDSGGPVYLQKNGKTYVVGATSRGDFMCESFGVYTALARFKPWIAQVMEQFNSAPVEQPVVPMHQKVVSQLAQALIDLGLGVNPANQELLPMN